MPAQYFTHVRVWVFDLDHTLYPPSSALFDQISDRMTAFIMDALGLDADAACALRQRYWRSHGTTLAGLMDLHDLSPEPYLTEVHDIDFSVLDPDPVLAARIRALPGRKIVYTNGTRPYAEQVIAARGLTDCFDAIYGVEHAGFRPKPERAAFDAVFRRDGVPPDQAAMFEDDPRNLAVPHSMGLRTVLVGPEPRDADHIHHHTDDLSDFLHRINMLQVKPWA